MNLGLNLGIGVGSGRGRYPASPSDIIQWLYANDGEVYTDKIGTLADAQVVDVPALELDGGGDYIYIDNSTTLGRFGTSDFTIDGWADLTDTGASKTLISKWDVNGNNRSWLVYVTNLGDFSILTSANGSSASTLTVTKASVPQDFVYWKVVKSGSSAQVYFNDAPATSSGAIESSIFAGSASINIGRRGDGIFFGDGKIGYTCITSTPFSECWPFEENSGLTVYGVIGGYHGTITTSDLATMRAARVDGKPSHNAQYGYRQSGAVKIPALLDGSSAADGNPITNEGGVVHNDGGFNLLQTDAVFTGGTVNFYSADGITADRKTYDQLVAHHDSSNGTYNLWVKVVSPSVVMAVQYDLAKVFTAAETAKNLLFFGGAV